MSIRRERGGGKRFLLPPAGFALACGSVNPTHDDEAVMNGAPGRGLEPSAAGKTRPSRSVGR
jgi:hypothetical protein